MLVWESTALKSIRVSGRLVACAPSKGEAPSAAAGRYWLGAFVVPHVGGARQTSEPLVDDAEREARAPRGIPRVDRLDDAADPEVVAWQLDLIPVDTDPSRTGSAGTAVWLVAHKRVSSPWSPNVWGTPHLSRRPCVWSPSLSPLSFAKTLRDAARRLRPLRHHQLQHPCVDPAAIYKGRRA
jgi:hypothetical protein